MEEEGVCEPFDKNVGDLDWEIISDELVYVFGKGVFINGRGWLRYWTDQVDNQWKVLNKLYRSEDENSTRGCQKL